MGYAGSQVISRPRPLPHFRLGTRAFAFNLSAMATLYPAIYLHDLGNDAIRSRTRFSIAPLVKPLAYGC